MPLSPRRSGVVVMSTKPGTKFEDGRTEPENEETNVRHVFEMLSQDLEEQFD